MTPFSPSHAPTSHGTILIVDDDPTVLAYLKETVDIWGYHTRSAFSGPDALNIIDNHPVDLILSDQSMPGMDGLALLEHVKKNHNGLPFIMLTGHGSVDKAVLAIKSGAADYLMKPCSQDELRISIERVLKFSRLRSENLELKQYGSHRYGFNSFVTQSPLMRRAINLGEKVAAIPNATVLIYGESGTGKELLARAIHHSSGCLESRFVGVNCAGIPVGLLESELFGHAKGAFTGAEQDRQGKFDLADHGTLLLDEIGDMPLDIQPKLLRVLQERCFEKLGANNSVPLDFRVILATHRDLEKEVMYGKFRKDLFHRINSFPIFLPPLRERKEDIPLLADFFLEKFKQELGKPLPGISKSAMSILMEHPWPGNVRELRNQIERAAIITDGELIRPEHLVTDPRAERKTDTNMVHLDLRIPSEDFSLATATLHIKNIILKRSKGNKSKAAELLKVDRKQFYR